jgi:hypothetical protein
MREIKGRRNRIAALWAAGMLVTVWFASHGMPMAAFASGTASIAMLVGLIAQCRRISLARLILDNRILTVSFSVISGQHGAKREASEEAVVSTFGLMIGSHLYLWGFRGVRLRSIEIDRAAVHMTFGDDAEIMRVKLLHGMTDAQTVGKVAQKIRYETGVSAAVTGW